MITAIAALASSVLFYLALWTALHHLTDEHPVAITAAAASGSTIFFIGVLSYVV